MIIIIQNLKHNVRTVFGESDETFRSEHWRELELRIGVCQVNGATLAIWAVISTIAFEDTSRNNGFGALLSAPFNKVDVRLVGFSFGNDTDLL